MTHPVLEVTLGLALGASLVGCGARSPIYERAPADAGASIDASPLPECENTSDCEGFDNLCAPVVCDSDLGRCSPLAPVVCNDSDPCTDDTCDPAKGSCVFTPRTLDNDKDGRKGPIPGHAPGSPGACGDDCDDTSAAAYPGAVELCDGVDNDCNGVVDDGASFVPAGEVEVQIDVTDAPSGPQGLGWSGGVGDGYLASYVGTSSAKTHTFLQRLTTQGTKIGTASQLSMVNADASGGALVWTGDRFGVTWYDRRSGDYEIYFNQVAPDGTKLGPDVQLTNAWGFSLYPQIAFTGSEYVVVWQDEQDGVFAVWGQRIRLDGQPIGENVRLTDEPNEAESPVVAVGFQTIGVAYGYGGAFLHDVRFRLLDLELQPLSDAIELTGSATGVYPTLRWNESRYVVAWHDPDSEPHAIYGSAVSETAAVVVPAKRLTDGPRHSRYPSLLPLGDRVLMVFSDNRDQNQGYEIYARMLDASLVPLSAETRVTQAPGDSVYPMASFGPNGDVGILFRDDRIGGQHVFFTRLQCAGTID